MRDVDDREDMRTIREQSEGIELARCLDCGDCCRWNGYREAIKDIRRRIPRVFPTLKSVLDEMEAEARVR